uniref:beta strand repeat-containing protein n=1 Tax=uncultured Sphingomonas sp. TaxID=158754 RepID=UPI0035CC299A
MATVAAAAFVALPVSSAHAQSVVSACTGVSLPRSVVTDITGQVLVPVLAPIQNLLGGILTPLNLGLTQTLASVAAGDPISLNVIGVDGNVIDVATNPKCVTQSDSFTLATPAGLALGGNQITGLGTTGRTAVANAANAIAFGDDANTALGATGAVAIGDSASVTAVGALGSVALGQNSLASGATLGNQAYLVGGTAPAEVNIGGRRLTGVAGGAEDTDAVNVAQLRAAATGLAGDSLNFNTTLGAYDAVRGGAAQRITNVAAGTLGTGSTDAVNGAQLGTTNDAVAANTTDITNLGGSVTTLNTNVTALQTDALQYNGTLGAFDATHGGTAQRITNVAAGTLGAGSTDAVNGAQLGTTNDAVAANTTDITNLGGSVTTLNTNVTALQTDALQYNGTLGAFDATHGGTAQRIINVAAGTLGAGSTDAVNGAQLGTTNDAVAANTTDITNLGGSVTTLNTNVTALQTDALQYNGTLGAFDATHGGTAQRITNVAAGALGAGSTDAVNGAQLGATNDAVTLNTTNLATINTSVTGLQGDALLYDGTLQAYNAAHGGVAQRITNVSDGALGAGSTDAVNGAQLGATNDAVASNTTDITNLGGSVATLTTNVSTLQGDALLYDGGLQAFSASHGGAAQRITNLAAGALGATSSDAVNGAQLFGLGNSFATSLGGSSSYNPVTGQVTAGIAYGGTTYASVQGAVSAIETSITGSSTGMDTRYFNANSVAVDSRAVGSDSTAIGPNALANADGSIAAGRNTSAMSAGSVAIGDGATTMSGKAVAIGAANIASGDGAVSIGDPNIAMGDGAVALGRDNQATGIGAVALGDTNFATGDSSVGIGQNNSAVGLGAVAIGSANTLTGANTIAIGSNNVATGVQALAIGFANQAIGDGALAIGANIVTSGVDTLAVGNDTRAVGDSSAAYGNRAAATGLASTALGTMSTASAQYALALGQASSATAFASTALGTGSVASGLGSVAIGTGSVASLENSVALGGASSTVRGAVTGYAAFGLAPAQTSLGEIAVGVSIAYLDPITGLPRATGERQITGVAAGSTDTDAVNVAQLRGVSDTLGTSFVTSLGGGASYSLVTGAVTGPTYIINGAAYANVGDALAGLGGQVGQVATTSVTYDSATRASVTLGGAAGTTVTNVAAGTLAATSSDAVNGAQLFATNQQVSANTTAITNLSNSVAGSTISPVQYSNPGTPTASNGGVITNDVTLVGANAAAPVALHNVAAGSLAIGSTDAVNGGQVAALAAASANAIHYDTNADGSRANVATLVGGTPGAAVRITNVANGALGATSTDAVNGQQLFGVAQTAQAAQTTANAAQVLAANSVQYDVGGASVSLGAAGAAPVGLHNVAAGTAATDAVNVGQLSAGIDRAISTSNTYTDTRIGQISYDLAEVRKDASGGTAAAMAMATIPQAYGPGMGMVGMGVSTWRGESAIAIGASKATADGRIVFKAGATYNTRGQGGAAGGVGLGF